MNITQILGWLDKHASSIEAFLDYEAPSSPLPTDARVASWLGSTPAWLADHRFIAIGSDHSGGTFAVWIAPGATVEPVVFFGSEGGRAVLTVSGEHWLKALAHHPSVQEHGPHLEMTSALVINDRKDLDDEARAAVDAYRAAVVAKFGALPPFAALVAVPDALQLQFASLIDSVIAPS